MHGSPFHRGWMWETKSENNITVNGKGMPLNTLSALGRITAYSEDGTFCYTRGDASSAFQEYVSQYDREILFIRPSLILVVDNLNARSPSIFNYHLHAVNPFQLRSQHDFETENEGGAAQINLLLPDKLLWSQTNRFTPPIREDDKVVHHHLTFDTPKPASTIQFVSLIQPFFSKNRPASFAKPVLTEQNGFYTLRVDLPEGPCEVLLRKNGFLEKATFQGKTFQRQNAEFSK